MKVTHSAWLDVGSGSPLEIYNAIKADSIPPEARATDMDRGFQVSADMVVNLKIFDVKIKFEWETEE